MNELVLGIDIGTGACKCCLADADGEIVCDTSVEYSALIQPDGTAEQHPDKWYDALKETLGSMRGHTDLKRVASVCVTGQMRGLTLIGSDNKPVGNAILWNDTRCGEEAAQLNKNDAALLKRITYNPVNTMCTLPKILWLKKYHPDKWSSAAKFIYPKDYINFRLTGCIATDHSDASGSEMYDFKGGGWSSEIIEKFSLEADKFPQIISAFAVCGRITEQAANETGLRQGIPVIMGGSDATVELFSIGVADDTKCKIRLGSSCGISVVVGEDTWCDKMDHYCWKPVTGDGIVLDINTRFCAQSVKWLRDVFYSECPKTEKTYTQIDEEAMSVGAGAEGLIYHPYLQGEDAPYWDMRMRGIFHGISANHLRPHFARAVYEGVAYSIKDVMGTYPDVYQNCREYKIIGGGAKSRIWPSVIVGVLGHGASVPKRAGAAYGACLIALDTTGGMDNIRDIIKSKSRRIEPDTQDMTVYRTSFDMYKACIQQVYSK